MPLNTLVKTEVIKNVEKYEGRVPHLYLDTRGKVTVGIGHLIPNKSAIASVTMYKKGNNNALVLATLPEKHSEYDAVVKQPFGRKYSASFYKAHTTLLMKDHDIVAQKEKHILSFYKELTGYYSTANGFATSFDNMPNEVQQALLDMVFNLGLTKLKNQYTQMNAHIKVKNWALAAKESVRGGISPVRNNHVAKLFLSAQQANQTP